MAKGRDVYAAKRRKLRRYRVFTGFIFLVLFVYIIGYLGVFLSRPSISVEAVNYGSVDVPTSLHGIIVRDETVVKSKEAGTPSYKYSEYERVKNGSLVCSIAKGNDTQNIEDQLREVDEDILETQKSKEDISLFKDDLDRISKTITESFDSAAYKLSTGNFSDVYAIKNNIQTQIDLRNQIWFTENAQSKSSLSGEKQNYEDQLGQQSDSYTAPASGIISFKVDNMEDVLTPDTIGNIAAEQTKMTVKPEYISKVLAVTADAPLFRLVKSNVWYIASYIPNDIAADFNEGDKLTIYTTLDDNELSTNVEISSIDRGDNESYIVFKSNEKLIDFIDIRTMDFKIKRDEYSGFKIPNEAIVEKVFLKIPKDCVMDSLGDESVIVRNGDKDTLTTIKISAADDENYLVQQDFANLKVGTVLVKGTGADASTYTISDVSTLKGVYVANSSVAEFTVINVLARNNEYSVVDSDDQYGLKVYDKIVSDAKTVEDEESVN